MKRVLLPVLILMAISFHGLAQEVADVAIKSRFQRDQGVYFGLGGAFVLGKTLGDYSFGRGVEVGYMKRLNKLISVGAGISTLSFKYDASKTNKYFYDAGVDDDNYGDQIRLTLNGGNVSMVSLGINLKLNFIPVSDASKFSVYGIITPFISSYTRGDVKGQGDFYSSSANNNIYDQFEFTAPWDGYGDPANGIQPYPVLKKVSKITGGANLGLGVEWLPARRVSYYVQATVGYTGAISYVSSGSYLTGAAVKYDGSSPPNKMYEDTADGATSYFNAQFPMVKKAFASASLKFGVAYNF